MRIIVRVKELRKTRNLTQEELAKQLNISRQSLISLEQGRWLPSLPLAIQLASFFDTPLDEVIDINEPTVRALKELPLAKELGWPPLSSIQDANEPASRSSIDASAIFPAINVSNDASTVIIEASVPGYSQEDIDIDISDESITITGNKAQEVVGAATYMLQEYRHQSFSRTISLPFQIRHDEATAKLTDGILTIIVPKTTGERPKTKRLKPNE